MTRRAYLGDLEEIVLLAVARCEPEAYGMRIRQEIEAQTERASRSAPSTPRSSVSRQRLRQAGAPAGSSRDPRARRFFAVTAAGARAAQDTAALRDRLWRGLRLRRHSEGS